MKQTLFVALAALCAHGMAQQPAPAWPALLLSKPMHIGDDTNKEMSNPKPDAPKFTGKFELPANVKPGPAAIVYVTIDVGGMVPASSRKVPDSLKTTKLKVNGTEVAILNKLVKGEDSPKNTSKLPIRIPGNVLRIGSNDLEIIPGATTSTIDDFELHRVVVASSPQ
jgi:hypothetical protein